MKVLNTLDKAVSVIDNVLGVTDKVNTVKQKLSDNILYIVGDAGFKDKDIIFNTLSELIHEHKWLGIDKIYVQANTDISRAVINLCHENDIEVEPVMKRLFGVKYNYLIVFTTDESKYSNLITKCLNNNIEVYVEDL